MTTVAMEVINNYFQSDRIPLTVALDNSNVINNGLPSFDDVHELPEVIVSSTRKKQADNSVCSWWWLLALFIVYQFSKPNKK